MRRGFTGLQASQGRPGKHEVAELVVAYDQQARRLLVRKMCHRDPRTPIPRTEDALKPKVMQICLSDGWGGLEMYPARIIPELARQGGRLMAWPRRLTCRLEPHGGWCPPLDVRFPRAGAVASPAYPDLLEAHGIGVLHCHKSSDLRLGALLVSLRPELKLVFTDTWALPDPSAILFIAGVTAR